MKESVRCETEGQVNAPWLGLDIGGANLKAAHVDGWTASLSFPLWSRPQQLAAALANLLENAPAFVGVAVTMTGELADCYQTRAHGVAHILEQVTSIIPPAMLRVYGIDGRFVTAANAARDPWNVAASNWHALSSLIGKRESQGLLLVVDIGSTTTDLIPVVQGAIAIGAKTDSQRLQCGALVYTGIERSSLASISRHVPLFGAPCPCMNETFATSRDVHLWLGDLAEEPECCSTADGRPATREGARFRLARMVGEDGSTLADSDVDDIANQFREDQVRLIARGMEQVLKAIGDQAIGDGAGKGKVAAGKRTRSKSSIEGSSKLPDRIIVCGHGDFLLEDAMRQLEWSMPRESWTQVIGAGVSRCAPAYAVAVLAAGMAE